MAATSPFHAGEQAVQSRLGVRDAIEPWARKVIRPYMPDQHRDFYEQLPFAVAAARDESGRPWVTLLTGEPGFISSPDATTLVFNTEVLPGDALESALCSGTDLGLLGIELETRRRNRVNGRITESDPGQLTFTVSQAFGNCPQYITERIWYTVDTDRSAMSKTTHKRLNEQMQDQIEGADTFFIASGHEGVEPSESNGMDASHRGGSPGFVRVEHDTRIVFPDYAGNNHFNTIGNLVLDPRVGVTFVDFQNGGLLQVTGQASIDWDSPAVRDYPGAQRLVIIDIHELVELRNVLPIRFSEPDAGVRHLRVAKRVTESADVVSFYLESMDHGALPDFKAGQHLPLEFPLVGSDGALSRTYSLSNAPGQGLYRISVKRELQGLVSGLLHDQAGVGTMLKARSPAGNFVLQESDRPVVLVSAGIGITPMVSLLHTLTATPSDRPVYFFHGARDSNHHPFAEEIAGLARTNPNVTSRTIYSRPLERDEQGGGFDAIGRIDADFIRKTVADLDADYYLCGPASFLAALSESLTELGVADERVNTEQF